MRCPYCGGINYEQSTYCTYCGRDLTRNVQRQPQQQAYQPGRPGAAPSGYPGVPPNQPAYRAPNPPIPPRPASQPQQAQAGRRHPATANPPAPAAVISRPVEPPPAPEPPAPFPPRTMDQLNALLPSGAQEYTVVESSLGDGKKKLVRIAYPRCVGWQQAATLLKAFKEQQEERFNTIIIQGFLPQQPNAYAFTNGQLQFDRNVQLGGQKSNRYIIETGSGFENDSVRFVLNE